MQPPKVLCARGIVLHAVSALPPEPAESLHARVHAPLHALHVVCVSHASSQRAMQCILEPTSMSYLQAPPAQHPLPQRHAQYMRRHLSLHTCVPLLTLAARYSCLALQAELVGASACSTFLGRACTRHSTSTHHAAYVQGVPAHASYPGVMA